MKNYQTEELDAADPAADERERGDGRHRQTMREGLLAMAVGAGLSVMQP
jgi:hypothetical protein